MFIYRATNTANGKIYIGACRRSSIANRKAQHKSRAIGGGARAPTPFHRAIRKYGWDAFTWEIVQHCTSVAELESAERSWIASSGSMSRDKGYNRAAGGGGTIGIEVSLETRARMSAALRRRHAENPVSAETRAKRSASLKGRKPSAATMVALIGRVVSVETRAKIGVASRGRKRSWSDQALENVRSAARKKAESGVAAKLKPWFFDDIMKRRIAGQSFVTIGTAYDVNAVTVFYFCKRQTARAVCHA